VWRRWEDMLARMIDEATNAIILRETGRFMVVVDVARPDDSFLMTWR
jgi:hypothetical protein